MDERSQENSTVPKMMFECPICGSKHRKVKTLFNHYIKEHHPTREEFDSFAKEIQASLTERG